MVWLTADGFQKGGVIMMLFWWAWFLPDEKSGDRRQVLVCNLCALPCAFILSRLVSFVTPFRVRPIFNPALHLHTAYHFSPEPLINWNAFPSDHATLFFALVAGLFFAYRRFGWIALGYVLLFICLPRLYLGIHHPTDIIAGAALGIGTAYMAGIRPVKEALAVPALRWLARHPASFYAVFFLYSWQAAGAFGWARTTIEMFLRLASGSAN